MEEFEHSEALKRALRMADGDTVFWQGVEGEFCTSLYDHVVDLGGCEKMSPGLLIEYLNGVLGNVRKTFLMVVPLSAYPTEPYLFPEDNTDPDRLIKWPLEVWLDFIRVRVNTGEDFIVTGSWRYPGLRPASSQVPKSTGFIQFTRIS